ncbi:ArsR/SmtB family transcription factor [Halobaculum sp. MBLA0143]|uniref:ArsR/SmtB family transcription factor n=1 Tax=Halobaculum sp. MBLA0143 TaxID=3079933 RepID=UPI003523F37C
MSESQERRRVPTTAVRTRLEGSTTLPDERAAAVLSALADDDCRAILAAVRDRYRSVEEIAAATNVPTSTTYRKLDRLSEAGLLHEGSRLPCEGRPPTTYTAAVRDVRVAVATEGPVVRVWRRPE